MVEPGSGPHPLRDLDALARRWSGAERSRREFHGQMQSGACIAESASTFVTGHRPRRDAHRATHGLRDHLEAFVIAYGPVGLKFLDDAEIFWGLMRRRSPSQAGRSNDRGQILDEDVGALDHFLEDGAALGALRSSVMAFLVLFSIRKNQASSSVFSDTMRRPGSPRRLDLDDVGAQPAEHLCAARPCLVLSQIQHHDPIGAFAMSDPPSCLPYEPGSAPPGRLSAGARGPFEAPITPRPSRGCGSAGPPPSAGLGAFQAPILLVSTPKRIVDARLVVGDDIDDGRLPGSRRPPSAGRSRAASRRLTVRASPAPSCRSASSRGYDPACPASGPRSSPRCC